MPKYTENEYMTVVQETFLRSVDLDKLSIPDLMFRLVDQEPLVPRYQVQVGLVFQGAPHLVSTARIPDPKKVGKSLAGFVTKRVFTQPPNEKPKPAFEAAN